MLLLFFAGSSFAAHTNTTWPENKRGVISLTFDDTCDSHLAVGIPALNVREMKSTFFLVTGWVASWDPWVNASIMGHEIGSHTLSHAHWTSTSWEN